MMVVSDIRECAERCGQELIFTKCVPNTTYSNG